MRPDALRPATAKAAASKKLATRLSKGERPYRKRMAEVGAVYDLSPVARRPEDIMAKAKVPGPGGEGQVAHRQRGRRRRRGHSSGLRRGRTA